MLVHDGIPFWMLLCIWTTLGFVDQWFEKGLRLVGCVRPIVRVVEVCFTLILYRSKASVPSSCFFRLWSLVFGDPHGWCSCVAILLTSYASLLPIILKSSYLILVSHLNPLAQLMPVWATTLLMFYLAWSQSALLYINGKDKEYILVDIPISSTKDPKYRKWKTNNATVMSWLLHFMKPEFSR